MFYIPEPPDETEIKSGTVGIANPTKVFSKKDEIEENHDIGKFAGISISNNSPNNLQISFGRGADAEKVDNILANGALEITTCPKEIYLLNLGVGDAAYTIYYDYYTKNTLKSLRKIYIETEVQIMMTAMKEISPMFNQNVSVIVDKEKSENILQKFLNKLRGGK